MSFDTTPSAPHPSTTDPSQPLVATACLDLLLIEMVPMAYRITAELAAKEEEWTRTLGPGSGSGAQTAAARRSVETTTATASSAGNKVAGGASKEKKGGKKGEVEAKTGPEAGLGIGGIGGTAPGMDEEETRDAVFYRLEGLGYRVGLGITEKFSRDKPRFSDTLDVIKFLCKDLWVLVFNKQIDNLKTNHRGIYVLTDNRFKPLTRMSLEKGREGMMQQAQPFLYFPSGVLRGALASLGIQANVQAESAELPGATFQIRTTGVKS
ncbi:transport protein particle component [Aulographum hederae CBS 113979]|uniref:Transport protein particle component n=1 Tax=Aulographum hederae CBS 113979 TaxID=1176131 RepID=A0A6G1GYQ9_9PEZI|nr:transport protein particle component [Aulographum hederae CBS 113979]